jgi:hypothetical protein
MTGLQKAIRRESCLSGYSSYYSVLAEGRCRALSSPPFIRQEPLRDRNVRDLFVCEGIGKDVIRPRIVGAIDRFVQSGFLTVLMDRCIYAGR